MVHLRSSFHILPVWSSFSSLCECVQTRLERHVSHCPAGSVSSVRAGQLMPLSFLIGLWHGRHFDLDPETFTAKLNSVDVVNTLYCDISEGAFFDPIWCSALKWGGDSVSEDTYYSNNIPLKTRFRNAGYLLIGNVTHTNSSFLSVHVSWIILVNLPIGPQFLHLVSTAILEASKVLCVIKQYIPTGLWIYERSSLCQSVLWCSE